MPTGDEDGRRGHRPATRALRCCFKLGAGCLAALGAFSFSEENDSREGRNTGTDVTALSACIGRLKLDRPNSWAGAPAQITALFHLSSFHSDLCLSLHSPLPYFLLNYPTTMYSLMFFLTITTLLALLHTLLLALFIQATLLSIT